MYGVCHHRSGSVRERDAARATARRAPDERVTDAERERTATVLSQAFRDGVIRVDELDQRLSAAYAAEVAADLDAVTADLPGEWLQQLADAEAAQRRAETRRHRWRGEVRIYLRVMALLVVIWVVASLDEPWLGHPWPIWPALGWGIPLWLARPRPADNPSPSAGRVAGTV